MTKQYNKDRDIKFDIYLNSFAIMKKI